MIVATVTILLMLLVMEKHAKIYFGTLSAAHYKSTHRSRAKVFCHRKRCRGVGKKRRWVRE
jgi:hypothetical protein